MDLKSAIEALQTAGWSETKIAEAADTSQSTINRIKLGKLNRGTSFDVGQRIVRLAQDVTGTKGKAA